MSATESGSAAWASGTALLERPMAPSSRGTSQPAISTTRSGATEATIARSIAAIPEAPATGSAPIAEQPGLVALPVPFGGGFALVVGLLALGQRQLELRDAP